MKTGRRKKNRLTKHSRIKRSGSVKRRIAELCSNWDIIDPITRGERLRELIGLGCTRRGLAEDLCVSPTNIRFHLDLAEIGPTEKEAVKTGGSAKQAFEALQRRRELQARMDRVRQEQATSAISDQLAKNIVAFCTKEHVWKQDLDDLNKKIVIGEDLVEQFFAEVNRSIELRLRGLLPRPRPAAMHIEFRTVCESVKPDQRDYDFWLGWLADWLAVAIMAAAPEAAIRDAALRKAAALLSQSLVVSLIRHFPRHRAPIYRR